MLAPAFEDFCQRLCATLGVPPPVLACSGSAPPAFTLALRGVDIAFLQGTSPEALMLVDFGELPQDGAPDALRALLEANFLMPHRPASAFGLHPASGHVVYQAGFALAQADVHRLAADLQALAEAVLRWRRDASALPAREQVPSYFGAAMGHFA